MRITAGKYKNKRIKIPDTKDVRPTLSKIRESIFNIIQNYIEDATFLDLFAGSGIMGIEAASRGASHITFIEKNPRIYRVLKTNLTDFDFSYEIYNNDANKAVEKLKTEFDIIFMDPPYNKNILGEIIEKTIKQNILKKDGMLIIEHSPLEKITECADTNNLEVFKEKVYGDSLLTILKFKD